MIVSNIKNFVFVHIPKTGGTSIANCLIKHASYNVRSEYNIGKSFLNKVLRKHSHAKLIKTFMKPKNWNAYFKFAFVRNPWALFVSLYTWLKPRSKTLKTKSFNTFITNFCTYPEKAILMGGGQYPFIYGNNGKCLVDFVGRFENYAMDLKYVANKLQIKIDPPHINKTKHKHYRTYYTAKTRDMLAAVCALDIKNFGYMF